MRYLFANVYGDADALIASMPADVEHIACGPTADLEAARDAKLADLGAEISCLPSLLYWKPAATFNNGIDPPYTMPAHWAELRIADMPKPWSWHAINAATS